MALLASERAAKWHVWLTFLGGTGFFVPWLIQGLQGAPRRFSVLPEGAWDGLTTWSLPFVFILALAQILFFWNVVATVLGRAGTVEEARRRAEREALQPRRRGGISAPALEGAIVLSAVALAIGAGVGGWLIGRGSDDEPASVTPAEPAAPGETPAGADGKAVFADANCGSCHTLADAGASGAIGPNLDQSTLTADELAAVIADGRNAMPPFAGQLSEEEITAVAAYIDAQSP